MSCNYKSNVSYPISFTCIPITFFFFFFAREEGSAIAGGWTVRRTLTNNTKIKCIIWVRITLYMYQSQTCTSLSTWLVDGAHCVSSKPRTSSILRGRVVRPSARRTELLPRRNTGSDQIKCLSQLPFHGHWCPEFPPWPRNLCRNRGPIKTGRKWNKMENYERTRPWLCPPTSWLPGYLLSREMTFASLHYDRGKWGCSLPPPPQHPVARALDIKDVTRKWSDIKTQPGHKEPYWLKGAKEFLPLAFLIQKRMSGGGGVGGERENERSFNGDIFSGVIEFCANGGKNNNKKGNPLRR